MTWQSILVPFALVLIILVVVLVFIPGYLERLSRVNVAKRTQYRQSHKELYRQERHLERLLTPYQRAKSKVYHEAVAQVEEQLSHIREELSNIERQVETLQCPQLFDYLFPAQHFAIAPSHINTILADSKTLKRIRLHLDSTSSALAGAREAFEHLTSLPARLQAQREVLTKRLAAIEAVIARERNDGMTALDDFARDIVAARRSLGEAEPIAQQDVALPEIDAAALAIQQAEAILIDAEQRATEMERERIALDRRIRRAAEELDNVQAITKSGPGTDVIPQVRPMLRRAAELLNESAQAHRGRREFNAAGADVTTAVQLTTFSRDLLSAHKQIGLLVERDDGTSMAAPIASLQREIVELLERITVDGTNGHSALAGAAVAGQAARIRTRADTLVRQQDEVIAELRREATRTKERLDHVWLTGQNLLGLALDDPLARRYANLEVKFEEAQRKPAALEAYRRDVAAFEGVWDAWVKRIQATRARIGRMREILPSQIDQALALAEPWTCLVEDLKYIQQRAVDFETLRAQFNDSHHRRDAEAIMDQLEAAEGDIADRLGQLKDRAARLTYLESDVTQVLGLASSGDGELPVDDPQRPRWDRVSRLIDHHIRSAHAALHYEDASVALLRAAEAANKLAL